MTSTPTPWRANLHHTQTRGGRNYGFIIADSIVPIAAILLGVEGMPEDEGRANAALIVRAVNAHADLLAALKWCVKYDGECLGDNPDELHAAKAAIRLAETP